ncbi:hypothetical protein BGZ96_000577 [Linnemannia gamsii]|uniref:F-box domain-containing protein n=1 Tax=Linnemannia gamsii TaxID=64522 RepID=A0ABQ7JPD5_9FUNG|nr:hypothetical protein BGZ96_000577 [Linnemannia gamsii]
MFYLTDPLDLLQLSHTCQELFYPASLTDWYSLANYTCINWVAPCGRAGASDCKTMVLKDDALGVRLGSVLQDRQGGPRRRGFTVGPHGSPDIQHFPRLSHQHRLFDDHPCKVTSLPENAKVSGECDQVDPESVIKYESLEPRQHQITMHGRIVKLYSALNPSQPSTATTRGAREWSYMDLGTPQRKNDRVAVFGTQNSEATPAMAINCITLFPGYNGYEQMLDRFNQEGGGMVRDWVNDKQFTEVRMPIDYKNRTRKARKNARNNSNGAFRIATISDSGAKSRRHMGRTS